MSGIGSIQTVDDEDDDDVLITVGEILPRVVKAKPLAERRILVEWKSGETDIVDIMPALASRPVFMALRNDDTLFQTLKVNEYGNAIEWDDGAELTAVWIRRLVPDNFGNGDFRAAMAMLGFSLQGMASALQVSRRLIADYRKDKPIPRHIALATKYLVEHRR